MTLSGICGNLLIFMKIVIDKLTAWELLLFGNFGDQFRGQDTGLLPIGNTTRSFPRMTLGKLCPDSLGIVEQPLTETAASISVNFQVNIFFALQTAAA